MITIIANGVQITDANGIVRVRLGVWDDPIKIKVWLA